MCITGANEQGQYGGQEHLRNTVMQNPPRLQHPPVDWPQKQPTQQLTSSVAASTSGPTSVPGNLENILRGITFSKVRSF